MARSDHYAHRARQAGYRSRAAYKLRQLDDGVHLFEGGEVVVDLGAAPGGWLQVAAERVGNSGHVIGVDRASIEPLDDAEAQVTTMQGDITDETTIEALRDVVGERGADVVLSDMAPDMSGQYDLDHARSIHLAETAHEVAAGLLRSGGDFVVKVFEGRDFAAFRRRIEQDFEFVRTTSPDASRESSSEVYVIGKGYLTAPVDIDEELEVTIQDVGSEGDGIARIDGYTVFVPETEPGDDVVIRITDRKERFGFAERLRDR